MYYIFGAVSELASGSHHFGEVDNVPHEKKEVLQKLMDKESGK